MKNILIGFAIALICISGMSCGDKKEARGQSSSRSGSSGKASRPVSVLEEPPYFADLGMAHTQYYYDLSGVRETIPPEIAPLVEKYEPALLLTYHLPLAAVSINSNNNLCRMVRLLKIDSAENKVSCYIVYPGGLRSIAALSLARRAMLEEVFQLQWKIVYTYTPEHREYGGIPAAYKVYGYSPATETYDLLLNEYTLKEIQQGTLLYEDGRGKQVVRDTLYFEVLPEQGFSIF